MIPEFENPSFVNDNDVETIHEKMMEELPADIDDMPGGFPWDFTRPTAIEKAELVEMHLVHTLMLMFPMWAWDEWLDYHADACGGIKRREAAYASGKLIVEGEPETQIKEGTVFSTASVDENPGVEFESIEEVIIDEEGIAQIDVIAAEPGKDSNVPAHTVVLMTMPSKKITKIYNPDPITGGIEEEDDESLRERIQELNENIDTSFVGNDSDYIRWSKEITGVGSVTVIPEYGGIGSGKVKLILVDSNGNPAEEDLCETVYNHIISPADRLNRKAPIGATLIVSGPEVAEISYNCNICLYDDYEEDFVMSQFKNNLIRYYEEAKREGILKYTRICSVLSETEGVYDFTDLTVNGDKENIYLGKEIYPKTVNIIFNGGDQDESGTISDE